MNKPQDTPIKVPITAGEPESEIVGSPTSGPSPTEAPLADFLQRQTQQRIESARAFEQDSTSEPSMRELLEEQLKLQRQVRGIRNHVKGVQQGLLICQFLNVLIAGALVAIAAFLYSRPDDAKPFLGMSNSAEVLQPEAGEITSEWPKETGPGEQNTAKPEQMLIIRTFLSRAKALKIGTRDLPDTRSDKKAGYIRLLVDLQQKGEEFAAQHESRELCEMLVKIAKYAEGNQADHNETLE
ncbi:MAG: hypothetical protein ACPGPS_08265, partial [Rubripirellula sp.]